MSIIPVMVTGVGGPAGVAVVKSLLKQNELELRVIVADMNPLSAGLYLGHKFYILPAATESHFLTSVADICRREGIKVLIPTVDAESFVLAQSREKFEELGVALTISEPDAIETCEDKIKTYKFFLENDIPTPITYLPEELGYFSLREEERGTKSVDYPLIIKPRRGRGSRDTVRVDTKEELDILIKHVPDPIIQKYIEGKEYTLDTLSDLEGRVIAVVPRERIETKAGISYKGRIVKDNRLIEYGRRIASLLKIKGPSNIQCMIDSEIWFTEINPRFSGGLPLTIAAGIDTPLLLVKLALGYEVNIDGEFKEGLTMLRYWEEVFL